MPWPAYIPIVVFVLAALLATVRGRALKARTRAVESWGAVDAQLASRRKLVPQIVATASAHVPERAAELQSVVETCALAQSAAFDGPPSAVLTENHLTGALRGLFVLTAGQQQLQADANFQAQQRELVTLENGVTAARALYNSNARRYNRALAGLPGSLFLGSLGFRTLPYVESAAHDHGVGRIDFA